MPARIHGEAAGVHADGVVAQRGELLLLPGEGVVETHRRSGGERLGDGRGADRARQLTVNCGKHHRRVSVAALEHLQRGGFHPSTNAAPASGGSRRTQQRGFDDRGHGRAVGSFGTVNLKEMLEGS